MGHFFIIYFHFLLFAFHYFTPESKFDKKILFDLILAIRGKIMLRVELSVSGLNFADKESQVSPNIKIMKIQLFVVRGDFRQNFY